MRASLFILLLSVGGCTSSAGWSPVPTTSADKPVVAWLKLAEGERPLGLDRPYGLLILWSDAERGYYLFDAPRRRYLGTRELDLFVRELDALCASGPVEIVDTCSVSRHYGMPEGDWRKISAVLKRRGQALENPSFLCYCESRGLRFPDLTSP